jgi:DNA-binding MarR family transcriptional regulator
MGEDSAVRAAREVATVFSRLRRRLREVASVDDLTPSQTSVLSRLSKDGPATASVLAAGERVRPQSMAATLGVLEERGLVQRHPDPDDGRRQLVSMTEAGQAQVDGTRQAREEWLVRVLRERYTEGERRELIAAVALVERLVQA